MDNQQADKKKLVNENQALIYPDITAICIDIDNLNLPGINKEDNEIAVRHLNHGYNFFKKVFNLNRPAAKKVIKKIRDSYTELPPGFKQLEKFPMHAIDQNGTVMNIYKRNILKEAHNVKGYPTVCLQNKTTKPIHRLVAETFIPNPDNKPQVNHIDGNKENNHVSNLEWVTNEENKQHAVENNLLKTEKNRLANTGSRNNGAKLTEEQVLDIRSRPYDLDKLSKEFNVSKNTIWGIFARRNWTHI